jgi:hypothetical protein
MSTRTAAWVAVPLGSLNVAFALLGLIFASLNGYSLTRYLEEYTLPTAILAVSFSVVGVLLASHRPKNPLGWIFLTVGFSQGLVQFADTYAEYVLVTEPGSSLPGAPLMSWFAGWVWFPGLGLVLTFVPLLFPNGQLSSRRWRPVAWLSVVPFAILVPVAIWMWPYRDGRFIEDPSKLPMPSGLLGVLWDLDFPLLVVCGLACVASLMVRFWRAAGMERQQIKWFAYAAAVMVGGFVGDLTTCTWQWLLRASRALLALVYFGGVATTQAIFRALTSQEQQPQLAVVVSTLVIAALFNPLRHRIQSFIDRRFYRRKYDARKTLEAFSAKLRDETDLDALSDDLVAVVRKTMQPSHVSLWLRPEKVSEGEKVD